MRYLLDHTKFGFCWLDIIAVLLFAAAVIYIHKKLKKMKEEKNKLEEQLAALNADSAVENTDPAKAIEQNAPNVPEEGAYGS